MYLYVIAVNFSNGKTGACVVFAKDDAEAERLARADEYAKDGATFAIAEKTDQSRVLNWLPYGMKGLPSQR